MRQQHLIWFAITLGLVLSLPRSAAAQADSSPRITPLVKLVQQVKPAVVPLYVPEQNGNGFSTGSGAIIHPDGYVLTNHHVVSRSRGFALYRGRVVAFVVVGRLPEKDIAVVRLKGVPTPLPAIALGHSHDVMAAEPVVVLGNPGGRGIVVTAGIISSARQYMGMNALVMSQFPNSRRDDFIQFDAASNRGNSGGPLINMEGELIGIVSALIQAEQNSSFAIPVDRVRKLFSQVVVPEVAHRRVVGLKLNQRADSAIVTSSISGSPAESAGVLPGDIIVSLSGKPIRNAVDLTLALDQLLPRGNPLDVVVKRTGEQLPIVLNPIAMKDLPGQECANIQPGLAYDLFHGKFQMLPDFESMKPHSSGVTEAIDLDSISGERKSDYGVTLNGLFRIEMAGLYRVTITSDDGSRVFLHDEMVIDHDGNHPPIDASRLIRLGRGLHPFRIEYFQGVGGRTLNFTLQKLDSVTEFSDEGKFTPEFFHVPGSSEKPVQ